VPQVLVVRPEERPDAGLRHRDAACGKRADAAIPFWNSDLTMTKRHR
jgi:hypothetical protein